jgi:O-acetyl-ADP-ribose deacetylase (regulator of RNase III)
VIHVLVGDLASVVADAVVRPATTTLEPITTALRRLDEVAGPRFMEQCRTRHELGVGSAVVTGGGDLAAEFVVHAVVGSDAGQVTAEALSRALAAALWQATQWRIETLALPAWEGEGSLSVEAAADAAVFALAQHGRNAEWPKTVFVVVRDEAEGDIYRARIGLSELH